jgi:hypothetical protein
MHALVFLCFSAKRGLETGSSKMSNKTFIFSDSVLQWNRPEGQEEEECHCDG